jgi:hypothetical protein
MYSSCRNFFFFSGAFFVFGERMSEETSWSFVDLPLTFNGFRRFEHWKLPKALRLKLDLRYSLWLLMLQPDQWTSFVSVHIFGSHWLILKWFAPDSSSTNSDSLVTLPMRKTMTPLKHAWLSIQIYFPKDSRSELGLISCECQSIHDKCQVNYRQWRNIAMWIDVDCQVAFN